MFLQPIVSQSSQKITRMNSIKQATHQLSNAFLGSRNSSGSFALRMSSDDVGRETFTLPPLVPDSEEIKAIKTISRDQSKNTIFMT
jgi:hypothetical protein